MDETPRRCGAQHRTSEERTPVRAESAEGHLRQCDQRHAGRRSHELPQAPRSFLALFSAKPAGHLEPISAHPGAYRSLDLIAANLKSLFQDRLIIVLNTCSRSSNRSPRTET